MITVLFALIPYCTPIRSEYQFNGCLKYLYQCVKHTNEETCVETLPEIWWPR